MLSDKGVIALGQAGNMGETSGNLHVGHRIVHYLAFRDKAQPYMYWRRSEGALGLDKVVGLYLYRSSNMSLQ
jgi:hypothetical protein